jgi:tripartite-type tricarboxylate transporter receptor subunit TctC
MVTRRALLLGTVAAGGYRAANADGYPSRPVKWIVPYPPGGATDITARLIAEKLSQRFRQPFIIESKPGAGANLGTEAVINSPADGYTLLFISTANAINTSLYKNMRFDFMRDIAPVSALGRLPIVMEVTPTVPAKNVSEFISFAKANAGKLTYASAGVGTSLHLTAELFKSAAGIEMVHVPYRGSAPALTDLIGGQVQVMFDNVASSLQHIKSDKLRALAVTTAVKFDGLPDVPVLSDTIPGFEAASVYGVGVPRATPHNVVESLNRGVTDALNDPEIKKRLGDLAIIPTPGSALEFAASLSAETAKWAKVVKGAGVSLD